MRSLRSRKLRRGFTMLEALVAAGVLAIGIVGVVALQATLFQSARYSQDISSAAYLLNHRIEELGSISIAALAGTCNGAAGGCLDASTGGYAPAPASGCSQQLLDPAPLFPLGPGTGGPYRIDTGIVPHTDPTNHPNALIATVSVCWAAANGTVRQIQAVRVLGDR